MVTISNANTSTMSSTSSAANSARASGNTGGANASGNGVSASNANNGNGNNTNSSSNNTNNEKRDASAVISTLGVGTSLSLSSLLTGLMQVASIPLSQYHRQQDGVKTELSAFAQLKNSLTTFQSSLGNLTLAANFKTLNSTSSDKNVAEADVFTGAQPGNYNVDVSQLAQAQTLVTGGQASVNSAIGSGTPTTLTFNFGTIGGTDKASDDADDSAAPTTSGGTPDASGHYGDGTTFTQSTGSSKTITINAGNNTLGGIRDAINNARMGVTASIVNDGADNPYRLVLSNDKTGAAQAMQITSSGDDAVGKLLSFDPTKTDAQAMTQSTTAQDAKLSVNGISLTSPTNKVSGALNGFTMRLANTGKTTLSVSNDTSAIETNIGNFVDGYNALIGSVSSLTNYDSTDASKNGPLLGDSTASNIKGSLQRMVSSSLEGGNGYNTMADVGITFNADGTLALNQQKLKDALSKNLPAFASLFATNGTTSDSGVNFLVAGTKAQAGKYDVIITQPATQGEAKGEAKADLNAASKAALDLTVTVNGSAQNVTLAKGVYATPKDLASALQKAINENSAFTASGASVNVNADDDGKLTVTSTNYGKSSNVAISGNGTVALFGKEAVKGTPGKDVAGTVGGFKATGSGQTLTGQAGTPIDGVALQVQGSGHGARGSVSYSVGFAARLNSFVDDVTSMTGSLSTATKALDSRVSGIDKQITKFQSHLDDVQSNYQQQFSKLNQLSVKMKTASDMLNAQFNWTSSH
ncbi:flagellar filament capping protein FliD [Robbsia sp. KACC 23696]|uniref:flagellar filament capping protein FliD n=1 Tax=Robbsia sp. KACC 23696 TaxID=3149231 RepID=UPI00325A7976